MRLILRSSLIILFRSDSMTDRISDNIKICAGLWILIDRININEYQKWVSKMSLISKSDVWNELARGELSSNRVVKSSIILPSLLSIIINNNTNIFFSKSTWTRVHVAAFLSRKSDITQIPSGYTNITQLS